MSLRWINADEIGTDGEGTVDGSHPAEMGFFHIADDLEPVIRDMIPSASGIL